MPLASYSPSHAVTLIFLSLSLSLYRRAQGASARAGRNVKDMNPIPEPMEGIDDPIPDLMEELDLEHGEGGIGMAGYS